MLKHGPFNQSTDTQVRPRKIGPDPRGRGYDASGAHPPPLVPAAQCLETLCAEPLSINRSYGRGQRPRNLLETRINGLNAGLRFKGAAPGARVVASEAIVRGPDTVWAQTQGRDLVLMPASPTRIKESRDAAS